jgi:hypothetical protein
MSGCGAAAPVSVCPTPNGQSSVVQDRHTPRTKIRRVKVEDEKEKNKDTRVARMANLPLAEKIYSVHGDRSGAEGREVTRFVSPAGERLAMPSPPRTVLRYSNSQAIFNGFPGRVNGPDSDLIEVSSDSN